MHNSLIIRDWCLFSLKFISLAFVFVHFIHVIQEVELNWKQYICNQRYRRLIGFAIFSNIWVRCVNLLNSRALRATTSWKHHLFHSSFILYIHPSSFYPLRPILCIFLNPCPYPIKMIVCVFKIFYYSFIDRAQLRTFLRNQISFSFSF